MDKVKCRAREIDPSFHVQYAISEDHHVETENLTHVSQTDDAAINERGDFSVSWVTQLADDGEIELLVGDDCDCETILRHQISLETAEQLADMFRCIVNKAYGR